MILLCIIPHYLWDTMKSSLNELFSLFERNLNAKMSKVKEEENSPIFWHGSVIGQTHQ